MLKIRLTRMGKKHQPSYRVVVTPKENPVGGEYIDLLGTYNPLRGEVSIDKEKALEWLNKGAQPSDRIARLLKNAGVEHKSIVVKVYTPKPKEVEVEEKAEKAPVAEEATESTEEPEATEEAPTETPEASAEEVTPAVESEETAATEPETTTETPDETPTEETA